MVTSYQYLSVEEAKNVNANDEQFALAA
jgi:hypothetical protein